MAVSFPDHPRLITTSHARSHSRLFFAAPGDSLPAGLLHQAGREEGGGGGWEGWTADCRGRRRKDVWDLQDKGSILQAELQLFKCKCLVQASHCSIFCSQRREKHLQRSVCLLEMPVRMGPSGETTASSLTSG